MFTTMRAVSLALLLGSGSLGLVPVAIGDADAPPTLDSEASSVITPDELLDLTFDGAIIPDEFVGVLFSRKVYPTDQEILYTHSFLPPNTFIRYVESGELGIRPNDETQIIRAGQTQNEAETVAGGGEAIVGPGDIFIQRDVPWDQYGKDALGEMWTPGDDAVIFSLAIREQERCCSMSHPGMRSPWYHTLTDGVQELSDAPLRFRVLRWELPVGESFTHMTETVPSLWAVDAGTVTATIEDDAADEGGADPRPIRASSALRTMTRVPGAEVTVENVGDAPAVLYQLLVEPAEAA